MNRVKHEAWIQLQAKGQCLERERAPSGFDAQISYRAHSKRQAGVQSEDRSSQLLLLSALCHKYDQSK